MVKYHIPLCLTNFASFEEIGDMNAGLSWAGIRLKYLHNRHFFRASQLSQKMKYRVEIWGT